MLGMVYLLGFLLEAVPDVLGLFPKSLYGIMLLVFILFSFINLCLESKTINSLSKTITLSAIIILLTNLLFVLIPFCF